MPILETTLREILQKKLEKINNPVSITELLVHHDDIYKSASYGESKQTRSIYSGPAVTRLIDHIEIIAKIANQVHEKNHFEISKEDHNLQMKSASKNKITRISLSEFSLYTKDRPLTMDEFKQLCSAVEEVGRNCHENLHLLLSTISVQDGNKNVYNYALYVECGRNTCVRFFAKKQPAPGDIQYKDLKNIEAPLHNGLAPSFVSSKDNTQQPTIPYNSLFVSETSGGAKFLVGVDICYDHEKGHTKKALKKFLKTEGQEEFIPEQISHIISSNTSPINPENVVGNLVTHADRENKGVKSNKSLQPERLQTADANAFNHSPYAVVID